MASVSCELAKHEGEISMALNSLRAEGSMLEESLKILTERLQPILSQDTPKANDMCHEEPSCPLAQEITAEAIRLTQLTGAVRSLLARCEL